MDLNLTDAQRDELRAQAYAILYRTDGLYPPGARVTRKPGSPNYTGVVLRPSFDLLVALDSGGEETASLDAWKPA
ncbi:Uncharacterised protein (plasmid) [Tsukamurella tyrosinosolvens]|uniref:Uncharacterized protein n=1 Tax=Tsukamurella tyrosinosolvens TaxID=57704 RepID=A0A1H4V0U4_TSUTY|nr:hypothetical protein [Tsukamurella tyrosinosolvens]KXO91080.1 hypothetical protein AXK58_21865 [Tsukamurella tyrosinosolvens]SEC74702.1 hypothetical protein SAMN04489793_3106 [Tsukamurella tyrosinosolvens]VEH90749.1 Uncharacterised protein [Tsukamurella tyrosinosolvens]